MKKIAIMAILAVAFLSSRAQNGAVSFGSVFPGNYSEYFISSQSSVKVGKVNAKQSFSIFSDSVRFDAVKNAARFRKPSVFVCSDASGNIWGSPLDSISLGISNITGLQDSLGLKIQTLSIDNRTISISGGNSVTVPQTVWDSILNKPAVKRQETFTGTTNGSGVYSVTFSSEYAAIPDVQCSILPQSATNQFIRISAVSTTGFTVHAYQRATLTVLGIELLAAAVTNVSGATVSILVTER